MYSWIVDGSLGTADPRDRGNIIAGAVWFFETVIAGPEVDAGSSIVTWLEEGTISVDLNGTVVDATGDVTAIARSVVVSPPDSVVNIASTSAAVTTTPHEKGFRRISSPICLSYPPELDRRPHGHQVPMFDFGRGYPKIGHISNLMITIRHRKTAFQELWKDFL